MVAHGLYCKQIYSYNGMLESLSGASVDVVFLSFDEVLEHGIPEDIDVIINAGDAHIKHRSNKPRCTCYKNALMTEEMKVIFFMY